MWQVRCRTRAALCCAIGVSLCAAVPIASQGVEASEEQAMNTAGEAKHTNRLIHATSPYLLQHAHNPIDWYEWSDEAFAKARKEDKPVFLSIGYSACHWCHVMAHETFENEDVAAFLNEHFVCIKVDREERPDVDEIYMHVTQMMNNGSGGWPMSVFLMPDRRPIYAGTYFPRDRFLQLSEQIHIMWSEERDKLVTQGERVQKMLDSWARGDDVDKTVIAFDVVDRSATLLAQYIDRTKGGFQSNGNKFPPSMALELMLRVYRRTGEPALLEAVEVTLDNMARGGIYDHLGGGICRYSTDPDWLVPHFEKMLYDQALVSSIYLDAYQVTHKALYADVARDIFRYVRSDLQSPEGGFYSTRDADSEGLEGAYYIWTVEQIRDVLGKDDADLFCKFYDVTETGNWFESRGHAPTGPKNILHVSKSPKEFAKLHNLSAEELRSRMAAWREKLLEVRGQRVPPGLDDKILAGWNGLMIASLAKGAAVLDDPTLAKTAERAATFVLDQMRRDGRLLRTHRKGTSRLTAYLSDYAFLIDGLLNLYEATFDKRWLDEAEALCEQVTAHYRDAGGGAFYFTANDAEELIARTKNPRDGAIPSGNSVHASNLLRLGKLLGKAEYREMAAGIFRASRSKVESSPAQFERLLCAVDFYHDRTREIAIVGAYEADGTRALIRTVFSEYLPNKVVVWGDPSTDLAGPLLKGKKLIEGKPAAFVCENYLCKKPVTDVEGLRKQLGFK